MSSGDTPPVRFTSPSATSASTKKYPGTPKSPMLNNNNINSSSNSNTNTGNRNSQARQRLLSSKISAPRPINLPSLRREHAVGTDVPASSPATSHGWGSATSSPLLSQQQAHTESDASEKKHDTESSSSTHDKSSKPSDTSATSPVLVPATATSASSATPTRAWAVPTITQTKAPPSTDFPTAAEAASGTKKKPSLIDDKEYLKYASSNPNHRSWDEMVSEDLDDFSVDVVEFDDGTKVQVGSDASSVNSHTSASRTTEPVLPSERFTDDYDRSYPPKQPYHHHHHHQPTQHYHQQQHHDNDHTNYKPYRRSEDHGYSSRYNNNRRHSAITEGGHERRTSGTHDRWTATSSCSTAASTRRESTDHPPHYGHRRPSYDRKHDTSSAYHPTSLLQRPRRLSEQSFRSDHSREDMSNPLHIIPEPTHAANESTEEIIVVQKNLMLTAAERAKKRLEEQEAEFKAAAERAKQKADALAAKQAELKEKTILKKPAASVDATPSKKPAPATTTKASPSLSNVTATTQTPKTPLPPRLPDTSKPWNLVAAKKQAPPTTTPPATATAASAPSSSSSSSSSPVVTVLNETQEQTKEPPSQTSKEPLSTPSKDHQPTQILKHEEHKPVTIMKKEPKPVLKKQEKEQEQQEEDSKSNKPLTEDEKNWQQFVSTIKTDQQAAVKKDVTSVDWNSYADRLQETTAEQDAIAASTRERLIREVEKEIELENQQQQQQPQTVEVFDYEENWGSAPVSLMHDRHTERGAWIREDNAYNTQRGHRNGHRNSSGRAGGGGGGRGSGGSSISRDVGRASHHTNTKSRASTDDWRHDTTTADKEEKKLIVVEILKKQEPVLSKKTRLSNLLKESSSPIFPDFIDKLAAKKPANMSFMVETEESDKEITMMGQDTTTAAVEDEAISVATTHTTTTENSPASTPPKSQFPLQQQQQQQQQKRLNVNRHFPVLVYQYPAAPSATVTSDQLGSPSSSSMDVVGSKSPLSHHPHSPQNRPLGVYLMPQQPFLTSNQYVVPYPQVGTSNVQPIYYPTLSWQQQQSSGMAPRFSYDYQHHPPQRHHRRSYNTHYNDYPASNNGHRGQHKYPHQPSAYQNTGNGRGNSYRKRGGGGGGGAAQSWSGAMMNNTAGGRGTVVGKGSNGGHYPATHNTTYNRKYSRSDNTDTLANASPSPAVDSQQPSL